MGPEAAVNAVYSNKIDSIEDPTERSAFVKEKIDEFKEEIDIYKLASNLIIDDIVLPGDLRNVLIHRLMYFTTKQMHLLSRKHPVNPV